MGIFVKNVLSDSPAGRFVNITLHSYLPLSPERLKEDTSKTSIARPITFQVILSFYLTHSHFYLRLYHCLCLASICLAHCLQIHSLLYFSVIAIMSKIG